MDDKEITRIVNGIKDGTIDHFEGTLELVMLGLSHSEIIKLLQ